MTNKQFVTPVKQTDDDKGNPFLVATIPYSTFTTAGNTYYFDYIGKLNRNAKKRIFFIVNNLNQGITNEGFNLTDSYVNPTAGYIYGDTNISKSQALGISNIGHFTSDVTPALASPVDSFQLSITAGSTLPTSGDLLIYVYESF